MRPHILAAGLAAMIAPGAAFGQPADELARGCSSAPAQVALMESRAIADVAERFVEIVSARADAAPRSFARLSVEELQLEVRRGTDARGHQADAAWAAALACDYESLAGADAAAAHFARIDGHLATLRHFWDRCLSRAGVDLAAAAPAGSARLSPAQRAQLLAGADEDQDEERYFTPEEQEEIGAGWTDWLEAQMIDFNTRWRRLAREQRLAREAASGAEVDAEPVREPELIDERATPAGRVARCAEPLAAAREALRSHIDELRDLIQQAAADDAPAMESRACPADDALLATARLTTATAADDGRFAGFIVTELEPAAEAPARLTMTTLDGGAVFCEYRLETGDRPISLRFQLTTHGCRAPEADAASWRSDAPARSTCDGACAVDCPVGARAPVGLGPEQFDRPLGAE